MKTKEILNNNIEFADEILNLKNISEKSINFVKHIKKYSLSELAMIYKEEGNLKKSEETFNLIIDSDLLKWSYPVNETMDTKMFDDRDFVDSEK